MIALAMGAKLLSSSVELTHVAWLKLWTQGPTISPFLYLPAPHRYLCLLCFSEFAITDSFCKWTSFVLLWLLNLHLDLFRVVQPKLPQEVVNSPFIELFTQKGLPVHQGRGRAMTPTLCCFQTTAGTSIKNTNSKNSNNNKKTKPKAPLYSC